MRQDRTLSRRDVFRAGGSIGVAAVVGCLGASPELAFEEGFEGGLGDWESDAAIGSEVDIEEFAWEVDVSDTEAAEGARSLRVWNQGDYDDGVTWGLHPISVESGQAYQAEVTTQFWSESESFNTLRDAVMRLAPEPPEVEEDFPHPGVNTTELGETEYGGLREPLWLTKGWREYRFQWTTPELDTDTLYIAVGTAVTWESDLPHFVDEITVEFENR